MIPLCEVEHKHEQKELSKDDIDFIDFFEQRIKKTIEDYEMVKPNDKLVVAVSGGKDSTAVLWVMKKLGYDVEAVTVDAHIGCYTQKNLENIRTVCNTLKVSLHELPFRKIFGASLCYIRDMLKAKGHDLKSCTVCGVLRRSLLNKKSRELGATKLVMGHNLDDEAQAFVMNLFKNRLELSARMGPVNGKNQEGFVSRIKPLYFTPEKDVIRYSQLMQFPVHIGKCPCSVEGFRNQVKDFLNRMELQNKNVKQTIVSYVLKNVSKIKNNPQTLNDCSLCGEPCAEQQCRPCQILSYLKEPFEGGNLGVSESPEFAALQKA